MLDHHEDQIKGVLGFLLTSLAGFIEVLPPILKAIAGIGGVILMGLSIRGKILDIKIKKQKLNDERDNT